MPIIAARASAAYGAGFSRVVTAAYAGPFGAYDALASVTVGGTSASRIDFNGIPQGYKHLQVRIMGLSTGTNDPKMRFNDDFSPSNYFMHSIYNNVSAVTNYNDNSAMPFMYNETTVPALSIIDIFDYSRTTKNKTARIMSGYDTNTGGFLFYRAAAWFQTTAVNQITFYQGGGGNWQQYSSFALYGIK